MTNKHPLLSEYKQYLQTISVKQGTKNVYSNSFYKYLKQQGIHKKEELIQQLQQEQKPPNGLYHVYRWLNISTPTEKKRKTRLLQIEPIIKEYREYLKTKNYTEPPIKNYQSDLRIYLHKNNITTKQELITKLQNSHPNEKTTKFYKWLNIDKEPIKKKGYSPSSDETVQNFFKERNLKEGTYSGYLSALLLYIPLCGFKNAKEMIQEALEDEKNRVPIKEARITQHLREWKRYLVDAPNVKTDQTLHTYFTKVETFYRHYNVTVPARPPMKMRNDYHVSYYDLPNKEMIEKAITQSDMEYGSLIYFMSSSGTAKAETLNMTIDDFLNGLREYTEHTQAQQIIEELKDRRDLVPIIKMQRLKTNVPYYTCCSPEATYHILQYLSDYKYYDRNRKVWDMKGSKLMKYFQQINDRNEWGFVGPYRRFRTHTLRKFHASNIGCSFDIINTLEGRTNGTIHETYVKQKPDQLKKVYMEHMCNVMIHPEQFIGPHCGGEREEEKIKNSIKELVPDLVPTLEQVQQQAQVVQPSMVQQAPFDYNILKDIARLETRMDAIEQRLEKLGG